MHDGGIVCTGVLDPYKLTWFSNMDNMMKAAQKVLDPYKLTWFSNSNLKILRFSPNFYILTYAVSLYF